MKLKSLMLMSLSALVLAACSSDTDNEAAADSAMNVSFVAGMPGVDAGTRTSFDVTPNGTLGVTYSPLWSAGERLSLLYGDNKAVSFVGMNTDYAAKATFKYDGTDNPLKIGNTVVAINKELTLDNGFINPAGSRGIEIGGGEATVMDDKFEGGFLTTTFKSEQTVNSGAKIDEGAEILVSAPALLYGSPKIPLEFKRYNGILCVNVSAKGDAKHPLNGAGIKEIQFTTGDPDADFGGSIEIDVSNQTLKKINGSKVVVRGAAGEALATVGSGQPVYLSVLPTTIATGKTFTMYVLTTDGRTYERVLKAPAGNVNVAEAKVTTFNVAFGDKDLKVMLNPKNMNNNSK